MAQAPLLHDWDTAFIELQSVDSTNNYARGLIHCQLARHGMAIYAHEQTAGKGQRGKSWITEKNANLIVSIIIQPAPLELTQQFWLSACVAVAVQDFFSAYAGDDTKIKWPNDLYWQDRKAGGMLIESVVRSLPGRQAGSGPEGGNASSIAQWDWAIAGIGVNINQTVFSPNLPNPVSLKQITGKEFNPVTLAKEFCIIMEEYFRQLITKGFTGIYDQYNHHLYKRNEPVRLKKDNRVFEATIKYVSPSGKLIVQHSVEEEFDFGQVEWLL